MLTIRNLHVSAEQKEILKGVDLQIKPGEIHAIMGPNGSGKSTLANVIAGRPGYRITQGDICFEQKNITEYLPEARAHLGIFLGFQYPVEITGITNMYFLKTIFNAIRHSQGKPEVDAIDFLAIIKNKLSLLNIDESMMYRAINESFSGGEKKRNEILQMLMLEPKLAVLDETDSGLDIDALRIIAEGIHYFKHTQPSSSFLLITHYQRLLDYIKPDHVHVLSQGKIIKSGDEKLALALESKGYAWVNQD